MGSKKKKDEIIRTNAYGTNMTLAEKNNIDNHNNTERNEGAQKDSNYVAERQAIAKKNGTVQYKSIVRKHLDDLKSILGVRK